MKRLVLGLVCLCLLLPGLVSAQMPHTFGPMTGAIPLQYLDDNFTYLNNGKGPSAYAYASLPAAPTAGTLAIVTDTIRGLWVYYANQWFSATFDLVNPKWFGAKCDSATDDTTALTNAIAAVAAGGTLRLPAGYCIATNLTIALAGSYQPINIEGLGVGLSGIMQKTGSTGALLTVTAAAQYAINMRWQNFTLHGNSLGNNVLVLPAVYGVTLSDVLIGYSSTATGLTLNGTENFSCWNCYIQNNATGVSAVASGGYSPNLVKFYGGQFATNTTRAVLVDHATGWKFDGMLFSGNGTAGNTSTGVIKATNVAADASLGAYLSVRDSWFESNNGNSDIEATGASGFATAEVSSNTFLDGGATGPPYCATFTGGSLLWQGSPVSSSGGGAGHYYIVAAASMESVVVLNSRIGYTTLQSAVLVAYPDPSTGNNIFVAPVLQAVGAIIGAHQTLTYGPGPIPVDASTGNTFTLVATNNTAFTLANPTNPTVGQHITFRIANTCGGAMGAITWDTVYLLAGAFTPPATGHSRLITFEYETGAWVEVSRTAADTT